jgi:hypothetical protein
MSILWQFEITVQRIHIPKPGTFLVIIAKRDPPNEEGRGKR